MENNRQKDAEEIQDIIKYYEELNKLETSKPKLGDVWLDTRTGTLKICNKIIHGVRYWSVINNHE